MDEQVSTGHLVLADISGYTRYLAGVELEHSHDILADLLGLVAASLCPPLELAKLEGDAVFCFRAEDDASDASGLLASLERTYLAFARRRRTVALSSSCTCEACRRVPELDLKLFAHRGSFIEHEVAGSRELLGTDVVLVHRLLKNTVAESGGPQGYALLTDACALAEGERAGLRPHVERYEDVGEVRCGLLDLDARWRAEQDEAGNVISREEARFTFDAEVDRAPQEVWEALTDPAHGMRWKLGVDEVREENPASGRGVGTVTHCVHGRRTIEQEIVDWLPPLHLSFSERNPLGLCMWTMSLAPLEGGSRTRIEWRIALRGGRGQALKARLMGRRVNDILGSNFESLVGYLQSSREAAGTLGGA